MLVRYYAIHDAREKAHALMDAATSAKAFSLPIVVALLPTPLPVGEKALLLRRVRAEPQNVIVLGSDADGNTLGTAIRIFRLIRAQKGDSLISDEKIVVRANSTKPFGPKLSAGLSREIATLRGSPSQTINGYGSVKAMLRVLPPAKTGDLPH